MSLKIQISDSMIFDDRLSFGDIKVYCALLVLSAGVDRCVVTKRQIEKVSGMNKIVRHTNNLELYKYIIVKRSNGGEANVYMLPLVEMPPQLPIADRLSSFMEEYVRYSTGVHSSATTRTYTSCIRELIAFTGDVSIKSVDVRIVEKFLSHKKLKVSAYTSRKHYISLKSVFERAVVWEIIPSNPFKKIKMPRVPETEVAYFQKEELQSFISTIADPNFRDLALFAFYSSFRRSEILNLRWCDIDLDQGLIHLRNRLEFITKSKRNRSIGINPGLAAILYRRKQFVESEDAWLFSNSRGGQLDGDAVSKKFKKYVRSAGVNPALRLHSLRHSSTSLMLAMGAPSVAVQRHLGHQRLATTEKYSHVSRQLLIETANSLPILLNNTYHQTSFIGK
jgi:integrase